MMIIAIVYRLHLHRLLMYSPRIAIYIRFRHKKNDDIRHFPGENVSIIFSAQRSPSMAAETIPPAYPAPSPHG